MLICRQESTSSRLALAPPRATRASPVRLAPMKGSLDLPPAVALSLAAIRNTIRLPELRGSNGIILILLGLALVRGILYAVLNPPFGSPDERDHFQYVAYLATNGAAGPIGEEGHQPVGYYALMVPTYRLTTGHPAAIQLLAIRLASIPFLLGTVVFTWLAARKMTPRRVVVPILAASMVALHPQLAYIGASANNDGSANFMGAVLAYLVISLIADKLHRWVIPVTAVASGIALLTKGQILPMVAVSVVALTARIVATMRTSDLWKLLLFATACALVAAAFVSSRAGQRMLDTAGAPGSMLVDWPKAWGIAQQSGTDPLSYVFTYTLTSFWAALLGESVRPANVWYIGPTLIVLLAAGGYLLRLSNRTGSPILTRSMIMLRVVLFCMVVGVGLVAVLRYLYWFQFDSYAWRLQILQGRFLHVALAPLALLTAEGWSLLLRRRSRAPFALMIVGMFALLDANSLAALASHYSWPVTQ